MEVGEHKEEIITSKKLIAILETPRFINSNAEVQVSLEASGNKNKTMTIAPEDSERNEM